MNTILWLWMSFFTLFTVHMVANAIDSEWINVKSLKELFMNEPVALIGNAVASLGLCAIIVMSHWFTLFYVWGGTMIAGLIYSWIQVARFNKFYK